MENESVEVWKDVVGYEGLYMVSNKGRVKSLHKGTRIGNKEESILKAYVNNGYPRVMLTSGKKKKGFRIHRLVAIAFLPNPNNYGFVNHIDENKSNNCVENLEWCTVEYNNRFGSARFRQAITKGQPVAQMNAYGHVIAKYVSLEKASEMVGIDSTCISHACTHNHRSGGYLWKFIDKDEF